MKITKRQLRRIIKEAIEQTGHAEFVKRFDAAYKQPDGSYSGHPDEAVKSQAIPSSGHWFRLKPKGSRDWYSWAQLESVEEVAGRTIFWTRSGHNLSLSSGDEYQVFSEKYKPNYREESDLDIYTW